MAAGIHGEAPENFGSYPVHWYAVCGIVLGCLVFFVGVGVCAFRCYRRYATRSASYRLSSAIKKGLKETGNKASVGVKKSPSSRHIPPVRTPSPRISPTADQPTPNRMARSPSSLSPLDPGSGGPVMCTVENENQSAVSPTEKEEELREKAEDELKIDKLGNLHFTIEYDAHKTALMVTVVRANDLPVKDINTGSSDPYVKLQLLPEKRHKVKTRVLRKTVNPVYDEIFTFYGITASQLQSITLHFVVLSFDRYSRDDIIGEVIYPLSSVGLLEKEQSICREISPRHIKMHSQGRGEILVSLCYQPAANRLTVVVLKARNLPKMDITGLSDPYVKVYLLYNGQRIAKKKTHVKKRTLNPVFNESFLFDVPSNEGLHNISLEFLVLDWDRVTKNEIVGRLEIGSRCGGAESHHWNEVMNCPRKQIADWHKLKD